MRSVTLTTYEMDRSDAKNIGVGPLPTATTQEETEAKNRAVIDRMRGVRVSI